MRRKTESAPSPDHIHRCTASRRTRERTRPACVFGHAHLDITRPRKQPPVRGWRQPYPAPRRGLTRQSTVRQYRFSTFPRQKAGTVPSIQQPPCASLFPPRAADNQAARPGMLYDSAENVGCLCRRLQGVCVVLIEKREASAVLDCHPPERSVPGQSMTARMASSSSSYISKAGRSGLSALILSVLRKRNPALLARIMPRSL